MFKSLTIFAIAASSLTGSALANPLPRQCATCDSSFYIAIYDHRIATPFTAPAPPARREDFGSFGAGGTARNLGY